MNILILILILLLLNIDLTEGFQINRPPQDTPDDVQFIACHDYSNNNNLGNNNYKVKSHGISVPLQGPYSHFLNRYKLRNYDEVFHSPACGGRLMSVWHRCDFPKLWIITSDFKGEHCYTTALWPSEY